MVMTVVMGGVITAVAVTIMDGDTVAIAAGIKTHTQRGRLSWWPVNAIGTSAATNIMSGACLAVPVHDATVGVDLPVDEHGFAFALMRRAPTLRSAPVQMKPG
jgi:fructose-specific phosphotransferase system IIC component